MGFIISKLLWTMFCPSSLLIGLFLLGALLHRRRFGRFCLLLGFVFTAALAVLPLSWAAARELENRFPPAPLPDHIDGIILLGGAVDPDLTAARGLPAVNAGAERMISFVALAQRYPQARLLFTGGRGLVMAGATSEADVTRMVFAQLGFTRPVEYESKSRTTLENAVNLYQQVHPRPGETWLLVTSALHMPRAMGLFREVGWNVLAEPASYVTGGWRLEFEKSLPEKLFVLDSAAHEWAGLVVARLGGRTASVLPSP